MNYPDFPDSSKLKARVVRNYRTTQFFMIYWFLGNSAYSYDNILVFLIWEMTYFAYFCIYKWEV